MSKEKIGFIGLGRMGKPMALNILKGGYPLTVYNRDVEKTKVFSEAGAQVADSILELAKTNDVVFTMLSDSAALEEVILGKEGVVAGIQAGTVVIDMSTVDPEVSKKASTAVKKAGGDMLDAPVSGSVALAEAGTLSLMVGGDEAIHERVKDILLKIGVRTTHVGENGAGASMKLAVNIIIGVTMQVVAEGINLAERSGIDTKVAIEVLSNSAIASPFLKYKIPQLLEPAGPATFTTNLMQKDFTLALKLARDVGAPLPSTAAANEVLTMARGMGMGDFDFAAVMDVIRSFSEDA